MFGHKSQKILNLLILLIFLSSWGCAGTTRRRFTVGVVDIQKVLQESKWGQARKEELIKLHASIEMRLHDACSDLSQLERQAEENESKKAVFLAKRSACTRLQKRLQKSLQEVQNSMYVRIRAVVKRAARRAARHRGLAVVLDTSGVLYSTESVDITDEVIRQVDSAHSGDATTQSGTL